MQAIITRYIPRTHLTNARVSAKAQAGRVILDWKNNLSREENHLRAANALCAKYAWKGRLTGGALPDGTGFAFVFENDLTVEI